MKTSEAKTMLSQSNLETSTLKVIWDFCDRGETNFPTQTNQGKGFLRRHEWILCLHLITYVKRGYPLPKILPPELESFLVSYQNTNLQSEQGLSSKSYQVNTSYSNPNQSFQSTVDPNQSYNSQSTNLFNQSAVKNSIAPTDPYLRAGSQPIPNSTAVEKQDLSKYLALLERAAKGYEVIGKKYSDETEQFIQSIQKIRTEKDSILAELSKELEGLNQDLAVSQQNKNQLFDQLQAFSQVHNSSGVSADLQRLSNLIAKPDSIDRASAVQAQLKNTLEGGMIPITGVPVQSYATLLGHSPNSQIQSYGHTQHQSHVIQETNHFKPSHNNRVQTNEEDMFA